MGFREDLKKRRLYLEGGFGTELQKKHIVIPEIPEILNITCSEVIQDIQQSYLDAGTNILQTCTFGANAYKMADSAYSVEEVITAAVQNARHLQPDYVALDIGPIGTLIGSLGTLSFEDAVDIFKRSVSAGVQAGVDLILIETITDIYEMKAAVIAAKESCDLPIIASMSYEASGRTLTGSDPLTVVTILEALGVDAVGINCSLGPAEMMPVIEELLKTARLPLVIQPNAGLPRVVEGKTIFDVDADAFSANMSKIAQKGGCILGGCCGTTPEHIRKTVLATKDVPLISPQGKKETRVASASKTVILGKDIRVIGERINPSASKILKGDLRVGRMTYVSELALKQVEEGADLLDINMGLPEIDEKAMMLKALQTVSDLTDAPLVIDTTDPEVLEDALRQVKGKVLINSVNGSEASLNAILPLAKKYGACVLGLTMDEKGLPKSAEERIAIGEKIMSRAKSLGIPEEDVLFDCLTLTASAQQKNVPDTLNALRTLKGKYHAPMVLGVSNISFGLPNRTLINRTFLVMAMEAGLDTPILNPGDFEMMAAIDAYRVLSAKDLNGMAYIDKYQSLPSKTVETAAETVEKAHTVTEMVVKGMKDHIEKAVETMLETVSPMEIVNQYLIPGLDLVGKDFETGKAFLPNLMASAETVQRAFNIIKGRLKNGEEISKGRILLATVQGDVHDIGKNILKVILENYGYTIIDLGKNVATERIVTLVQDNHIKLVGLSALMTTTVSNMEKTIIELKKACPDVKIMVGGAVLNASYAASIGADFYGKDARAGAEIAKQIFA